MGDETRARFRCPFFRDELDGSNKVIFGSSVRLDDPDFERHPRCVQQVQCTKGGVRQKWRGTARRLGADVTSNKMAKDKQILRRRTPLPQRPKTTISIVGFAAGSHVGLTRRPWLPAPIPRAYESCLIGQTPLSHQERCWCTCACGLGGSVRARRVKNEPLGAGNPSHDRDGLICGFLSLRIGLVRERALMSGWPDTSTPPLPRPLM